MDFASHNENWGNLIKDSKLVTGQKLNACSITWFSALNNMVMYFSLCSCK